MRLAEVSADFRPVVGHQEERIGRSEIARRNHQPRLMARPGETWPDRGRGEQAVDAAKYRSWAPLWIAPSAELPVKEAARRVGD